MDTALLIIMLVGFFSIVIGVGIYSRRHATDVNGFVLGGRSVGPWLTAFAFGTSYFSAVIFVGYAGQFGWKFGLALVPAVSLFTKKPDKAEIDEMFSCYDAKATVSVKKALGD